MKKRQFQNTIVAELLNNYSKRVPTCRHFMQCGGCSIQDFDYKDQLEVKRVKVGSLFEDYVSLYQIEIFSDKEFGYRTRMDYVVTKENFGLRKKRKFDVVENLLECRLIDEKIFPWLRRIYEKGLALGLDTYEIRKNEGFWRYLSLRINEKNQLMLILITGVDIEQDKILENLVEWVLEDAKKENIELKSVYHLVNAGKSDINFGEERKFWGDKYLDFGIGGVQIQIGPNNFFQNHVKLFNVLLAQVLQEVGENDNVLDLYCGVGTISLPLAKKVKKVFGVESVPESIALARNNAELNNIGNVNFDDSLVCDWLQKNREVLKDYNVAVLDPPRVGLEKAVQEIVQSNFEKIIYVSCNPLGAVKDLEVLTEKYSLKKMSLWDLYPQTPHVESLLVLEKIL